MTSRHHVRQTVVYHLSSFCKKLCAYSCMDIRLGKPDLWGPWRRVMVHRRKPSLCQNDPHIGGSFWHSEGLLRCTMTLLQGPKDPVLPNLHVLKSVVKGQFWSNPNYLDQSKSWPKSILNLNQLKPLQNKKGQKNLGYPRKKQSFSL